MIIFSKDISVDIESIGNKTKQLKILKEAGYNVPDFVAIPSSTVSSCIKNKEDLKECCKIIREKFSKNLYAVRSSALTEDGDKSSFAGQFETKIGVSMEELEGAITYIIDDAAKKLTDLHLFSIIIQEYIEFEFSGVCFTRNPNGGREMVIESHRGRGEELVSGKINPKQEYFYHGRDNIFYSFSVEIFENIEKYYHAPQDVEWGIKNNKLFILQTRPITTISREQYDAIKFLEKTLPKNHDFYYEKTEISEMAARPTPFTFSLLEKIYGESGPIMNVYKKHGIYFVALSFLVIIGNELYIDRNLETKTLLPAYSWEPFSKKPKLRTLQGLWKTIRNIFGMIFMKENRDIVQKLKYLLEKEADTAGFSKSVDNFLEAYETIFEINLHTANSLKKLQILLKKEPIDITDVLSGSSFLEENRFTIEAQGLTNLVGNTLEISDTEPFYTSEKVKNDSENVIAWWGKLSKWKKNIYKRPIVKALEYQNYREYARQLMIKKLHQIRKNSQKAHGNKGGDLYFSTITEIEGKIRNDTLEKQRKEAYMGYMNYHLPNVLSSNITTSSGPKGLSKGKIRGIIVTKENIESSPRPRILWTKILSPELTQYFDKIDGIITENGGLLSHLAIIAREKNMPVVVTNKINFQVNDIREIDGSSGEIKIT